MVRESIAFVSYSHKDSDVVYEVINRLHSEGYNIWYDEGIPLAADYCVAVRHALWLNL